MAPTTSGTAAACICNTDSACGASGRTSRLTAIATIKPGGREPIRACATTSTTSTGRRRVGRSAATAKGFHKRAKSGSVARATVIISSGNSRRGSRDSYSFGSANVSRLKNDIDISTSTASSATADCIRLTTGPAAAPSLHSDFAHTGGLTISARFSDGESLDVQSRSPNACSC